MDNEKLTVFYYFLLQITLLIFKVLIYSKLQTLWSWRDSNPRPNKQ
nr:MAG TPA: hypothetical protein [Caudoviricetes sp.]